MKISMHFPKFTYFFINKVAALSGFIVNGISFEWLLFIIALICIAYSPLMFFLKNPPAKEKNSTINKD